jgi:hypothetical protein
MVMELYEIEQETNIPQEVLINIRLLHKAVVDNVILPHDEKEKVQSLLVGMIGNQSLNRRIGTLSSMSCRDTGISTIATQPLKDISYRTRNLDQISDDLHEIWDNFQGVLSGSKTLEQNEKITLKQYGILYDLAILNATLETCDKLGLIQGNERLEQLYRQTQPAATIVSHLDNTFNQAFTMPTGAVVFDDTYKKSEIYGKELNFFEKLIAIAVTRYGHASKGIAKPSSKGEEVNTISHINPEYKKEQFNLRNYLYSDVYAINIANLIEPDKQARLKEHLGEDWLQQVEQLFSNIEREIHDMGRNDHVLADGGKTRLIQIGTVALQGGHKNWLVRDHINDDVRDDILGKGRWDQESRSQSRILCSEFVGKTIIAAIEELNTQLKQKLAEIEVDNVPSVIVRNPISEYEKLHVLTPQRLLSAMEKSGAIEAVDPPQELSQFITTENVMRTVKTQLQKIVREEEPDVPSKNAPKL